MRNKRFGILVLGIAIMIGCKQKTEPKISDFRISEHYGDFADKMENNDILNIGMSLSICEWEEFDRIEVKKTNDGVYLQIKEKLVMDEEPIHFPKILYKLKNDTLNLEKMMSDFDITYTEKISSPFFIITSPKEKDTILLRTTGLGNRGRNIERYLKIMYNKS